MAIEAKDECLTFHSGYMKDHMYEKATRFLNRIRGPRSGSPDWPLPDQLFVFISYDDCDIPLMRCEHDQLWGIFKDDNGNDQIQRYFRDDYNCLTLTEEEAHEKLIEIANQINDDRGIFNDPGHVLEFYAAIGSGHEKCFWGKEAGRGLEEAVVDWAEVEGCLNDVNYQH